LQLILAAPALVLSASMGAIEWRGIFGASAKEIPPAWQWRLTEPVLLGCLAICPYVPVALAVGWRLAIALVLAFMIVYVIGLNRFVAHERFYFLRNAFVVRDRPRRLAPLHLIGLGYGLAIASAVVLVVGLEVFAP